MTTTHPSTPTPVLLSTEDNDLGVVPASEAAKTAKQAAKAAGRNVTLRDPTTDEVLATVKPGSQPKAPASKRRLTELSVKKLKPRAAAFVVWDTHQRGLAIRVQPTGSRAWKVVYSRHGRPRWLHIGNVDVVPLSDARMLAAEAMLAVAKGRDPAAEKRAERGSGTFGELAAKYLEQHAKKHNRSWPQAAALVARHAIPRWGKLLASSLTRGDVKAMMARIEAPITANQTLAAVSAIFTWAKREDLLTGENPCRLISRNDTKDRERVLADSEVPRFWSAFGDAGLIASTALKVILLTGQRPGEVRAMRREHIVDGWWTMPGKPVPALGWPGTKNKQTHRVWLSKPVQELLAELSDDDATTSFVFSSRGRAVRGLDGSMRSICKALGIADTNKATPHDLRRTFLTKVTGLKFGRDAMDRIANHKEGKVTDTYDRHGYGPEDRNIMETVAAHLLSLAENRQDTADKVVPIRR